MTAASNDPPLLAPAPVQLDATDRRILAALAPEARASWAALGREVGLTAPAVRERVRRLERAGVIHGYRADLDLAQLGRPISAVVRVAVETQPRMEKLLDLARKRAEVTECLSLTGEDSIELRVHVASMAALDKLTTTLARYGRTTTSMVLAVPVAPRTPPLR
jgi:Lrp/AsnC family leucine-responsive transcriptional regulator